jgi:phospholipid/cholesterol/gamma-HCH transport system ATP-binding protein
MRGSSDPVLELREARPEGGASGFLTMTYNLRLMPGDCALIRSRDPDRTALFADLCAGMVPLASGSVRCTGLDWTDIGDRQSWALRGRIGRLVQTGAWVDLFGTDRNILTPLLHHSRLPTEFLVAEATKLAAEFGLPGLPVMTPSRLSAFDLRRAALVKAFLGEPSLLILDEPVEPDMPDLMAAFLGKLTMVRDNGAAVLWFSRGETAWQGYRDQASHRLRLLDEGLLPMGGS